MPKGLLVRVGPDTAGKLEAAAVRRFAEAIKLQDDEPLGALYLYGYTIEMRLKAAYYRLTGVPEGWDIFAKRPNQSISPRQLGEDTIRLLLNLLPRTPVGHHLTGWARLVIETRRGHLLGALPPSHEIALWNQAQNAARLWRETLRYHANKPYDRELEDVRAAARWLKRNYRTLWS
jgi:hypothetical protein